MRASQTPVVESDIVGHAVAFAERVVNEGKALVRVRDSVGLSSHCMSLSWIRACQYCCNFAQFPRR